VSQAVRRAAAYRLGRITETDYQHAQQVLASRMRELCASGEVRAVGRCEVASALAHGVQRVATMADGRAREELGNHDHRQPNVTEVGDVLAGMRDGAWLDGQNFPELEYSVPGLISEGVVLLVRPPKAAKSWFVSNVGLAVDQRR
jgi:hypothetical protein